MVDPKVKSKKASLERYFSSIQMIFSEWEEKREKDASLPFLSFLQTFVTAHASKPRHILRQRRKVHRSRWTVIKRLMKTLMIVKLEVVS